MKKKIEHPFLDCQGLNMKSNEINNYFSKAKFGNVDNLRTTFFGTPVIHAGIFLWEKFSLKIMVEKFALLRYYSITIFHNNSPSTITTHWTKFVFI